MKQTKQTKPFDRGFKSFGVNDPNAFFALFGGLPDSTGATVKNATKRIPSRHLDPDCILSVVTGETHQFFHFEAFARWKSVIPRRMYWYSTLFFHANGAAPISTAVLFRPQGVPKRVQSEMVYEFKHGHLWGGVRFRVIKLWEMDPWRVFRLGLDSVLPWVVFMKDPAEAMERLFERIRELSRTNPMAAADLAAQTAMFGGMRYDWNELEKSILGRIGMYIKDEVMAESVYYQHLVAKGREQGAAQAEAKFLHRYLSTQYPGLESCASLDELASRGSGFLDKLYEAVIAAPSRQAAELAIRKALRRSRHS